ncbi:MAG: D-2-hydroxyacid dehydrogenase family protein [Chromatiales bacterium]|nr:D-2-hydroxyacid dehydrogenase family protein [Chromatiales bacterium]
MPVVILPVVISSTASRRTTRFPLGSRHLTLWELPVTRIAILDDYQNVALDMAEWDSLRQSADISAFNDHLADENALVERLESFEIIMVMRERTPFAASLLARLPNLKLLVTPGMRNASIDLAAASANGITVCGTGGQPHPTAELAWGLILSLMRHIPNEDRAVRAGEWQHNLGLGLAGRTLGMIGLGRLGARVARVGLAFDMNVIAWSQNLTDERAAEVGVTRVSKQELLERSDVASIHLVLSERTQHLIGAEDLAAMKPTAYLVNTSRGPIVDEDALVEALRANTIAGAGLDVFGIEPLPADHPFRSLANTVLTPHVGYVTHETYETFYGDGVDAIRNYLAGTAVNVLNATY